jgi:hypothetical protein
MGYLYETCDQISDFCYQVAEKNILEERTDRQTEVKQYTPPPPSGSGGIIKQYTALTLQGAGV